MAENKYYPSIPERGKKWSWEIPPDPIPDEDISEEIIAEVVVIGAGVTGIPCAITAAEAGATVCVIEKTVSCHGPLECTAGFNSRAMRDAGYIHDRAAILGELVRLHQGMPNMGLAEMWVDESGEMLDWLEDILKAAGMEMSVGTLANLMAGYPDPPLPIGIMKTNYFPNWNIQTAFGPFHRQSVFEGIPDWTKALEQYAADLGVKIHYSTPAVQLVREEGWQSDPAKRVVGAIAQRSDGAYVKYIAKKGVFLATGSFDADEEMRECYLPMSLNWRRDHADKTNCTGDGHKMGMWVGAKMGSMFTAHTCGAISTVTGKNLHPPALHGVHYAPYIASRPVLKVNLHGRRFFPEDVPYTESTWFSESQPHGRMWAIWDGGWREKLPTTFYCGWTGEPGETVGSQLDLDVEEGITLRADSIEELVGKMNSVEYAYGLMDVSTFRESIASYNRLCAEGEDSQYYKDSAWMTSVDTPPYYAACIGTAFISTRGGLKIDTELHVLDENARVIPGLYAGGNPAENVHSHVYGMQGNVSGISMTFARHAAKNIVAGV